MRSGSLRAGAPVSIERGLQLLRGAGTHDRRHDPRPVAHPRQRDRERAGAQALGRSDHGLDDPVGLLRAQPVDEALPLGGGPAGLDGRLVPVLAGEQSPAQRRPGQHPHAECLGGRQDLPLHATLQQGVLDLGAHHGAAARPGPLPGGRLGGLPAGEVADPDVAGAPRGDGGVGRRQGLLERGGLVPGVQLPQVHVVDAEPLERGVERGQEVAPRRAAPHRAGMRATDGLGGDQHVGPRDDVGQQVPESALAVAVAVHVGRVDQGSAGVDEVRRAAARPRPRRCPGPTSSCERQSRHHQAASPELTLLHGGPTYRCPRSRVRPRHRPGDDAAEPLAGCRPASEPVARDRSAG